MLAVWVWNDMFLIWGHWFIGAGYCGVCGVVGMWWGGGGVD